MYKMINRFSTETKYHINQVIAQLGFILIGTVGYFFHDSSNTIIILNIIFAILLMIVNHVFIKSTKMRAARFKRYFDDFLKFVTLESNRFKKAKIYGKDEFADILTLLNHTSDIFGKKIQDDMKVMGEVVLTLDKVEQGIYGCRINASTNNPMITTLKKTINQMLNAVDKNMNELKDVVTEYANNDFRKVTVIDSRLKGEMKEVLESINLLGEALSSSAKRDLGNGQTLENNATKMNESVQNVAHKANEQAASLEQTAAAVEEITGITRNNAENAMKMGNLGQTVRSSVSIGQELASKTAISMDDINNEVTSINEAIAVIDQIAFQTNILSLNAAVEAATAGEAGKGFAVVAGEVRNLASRSSEAAHEIKNLVGNATSKANDGKKISDDMIKGYKELNTHITETIHIIEDVSSSSKEQMTGIEQINDAITMLDRVTQENASEATSVAAIANETLHMANNLVSDAKTKQFH